LLDRAGLGGVYLEGGGGGAREEGGAGGGDGGHGRQGWVLGFLVREAAAAEEARRREQGRETCGGFAEKILEHYRRGSLATYPLPCRAVCTVQAKRVCICLAQARPADHHHKPKQTNKRNSSLSCSTRKKSPPHKVCKTGPHLLTAHWLFCIRFWPRWTAVLDKLAWLRRTWNLIEPHHQGRAPGHLIEHLGHNCRAAPALSLLSSLPTTGTR
jgi:hypothetical protein